MSDSRAPATLGTDWTRILSDPDLVRHVGKLLEAYREAAPENREEALLAAMREIKAKAANTGKAVAAENEEVFTVRQPLPTPAPAAPVGPPFQPDIFSSNSGDDRRLHPRIKCYVAVELRVNDTAVPIWGNLSNTSVGGCLIETASPVPNGSKVEIGLWLANGKVWVKGFALNGIVTRSGPSTSIRVRFDNLLPAERDSLRQFLKYVQDSTRASRNENSYLELLK